jgi:hypothetical protein
MPDYKYGNAPRARSNEMWGWIAGAVFVVLALVILFGVPPRALG